jgi:hypothetical protein
MNRARDMVVDDNNVSYQVTKARKALVHAKEIEQMKLDSGYTWQKDSSMRIRRLVKPKENKSNGDNTKEKK